MDATAAGDTRREPNATKKRGKSILRGGKGVATSSAGLFCAIFA